MDGQRLITLGRTFGSGGHKVAQRLAERLDIAYYDRNILDHMFEGDEKKVGELELYDERHSPVFLTRHVKGHTNSIEEHLAHMEFQFILEKAKSGESFILVGRCGEYLLREYPNLVSAFLVAEQKDCVARVMDRLNLSEKEALSKIRRHDVSRRKYHETYSDRRWDDPGTYNICLNVSPLGVERTADMLLEYIKLREQ